MMKCGLACGVVALWMAGAAAGDETIESLEKKLDAAAAKVTSVSCQQRTVTDADMGSGNRLTSDKSGIYEHSKNGGKAMWRLEEKGPQVQKSGAGESKTDFESVKFDDGEHTWMVLKSGGQTTAHRLKIRDTTIINFGGKALFDKLRAEAELTMRPDESVDGKACSVIEAAPKMFKGVAGVAAGGGTTTYHIQQETGLVVKTVVNDIKRKPMVTMTRTEIKVNPAIGADRFKPPAGARVAE